MNETSKTKKIWGAREKKILRGRGIDIGCGPDPVHRRVRRFDHWQGDANRITKYVREQFDYVYSSHCLEHMDNPRAALREWWKLVKPGGHLFLIVPDEDLYEQGVFPSRFNSDHKATFTIAKAHSWSPVSINVLDLVRRLPGAELVSIVLQDHGYDRSLQRQGEAWSGPDTAVDQTWRAGVLAQIQCIVKKLPGPPKRRQKSIR